MLSLWLRWFLIAALTIGLTSMVLLRRQHQARLRSVCDRYRLSQLGRKVPGAIQERSRLYRGRLRRVRLRDVLAGSDSQGRFHVARRCIGRINHELLQFELGGGAHLDGFHVRPASIARKRRGAGLPFVRTPAVLASARADLELVWRPHSQALLDPATLSMAVRVLHHVAAVAETPRGLLLGVEIHGAQVLIHSAAQIHDRELVPFLDAALDLRRRLSSSLRRANQHADGPSPSGASRAGRSKRISSSLSPVGA